jgi:hypothetical protein
MKEFVAKLICLPGMVITETNKIEPEEIIHDSIPIEVICSDRHCLDLCCVTRKV